MPKPSGADIAAMRTNIPSNVQQAMNQQLQQTLPTHLKQYVGDSHGFVPPQAQREIAGYMQKMPGHLRQYSDAYFQQRVMQTSYAPQPRTPAQPPPTPNRMRLGHSMPVGEQFNAPWAETAAQQTQSSAGQPQIYDTQNGPFPPNNQPVPPQVPGGVIQPQQPLAAPQSMQQTPPVSSSDVPPNEYSFIMSPDAAQTSKNPFAGSGSKAMRIALILGGIFLLLIIFAVGKSFLSSNPSKPALTAVVQDQQELIHLAANARKESSLSQKNQNYSVTAQTSLVSAQSELLKYMSLNHITVKSKVLNLKVSTKTDQQLTAAVAQNTYNEVYQQIVQTKLTSYKQALKQAYTQTKGPNARKILNADYSAAVLLEKQLASQK
jgi:hypothetical protein